MSRRAKFMPRPRIWNEHQVACRLGFAVATFRTRIEKLVGQGFPQEDDLLGGWDANAVERWLDRRSGLDNDTGFQKEIWLGLLDGDSGARRQ